MWESSPLSPPSARDHSFFPLAPPPLQGAVGSEERACCCWPAELLPLLKGPSCSQQRGPLLELYPLAPAPPCVRAEAFSSVHCCIGAAAGRRFHWMESKEDKSLIHESQRFQLHAGAGSGIRGPREAFVCCSGLSREKDEIPCEESKQTGAPAPPPTNPLYGWEKMKCDGWLSS